MSITSTIGPEVSIQAKNTITCSSDGSRAEYLNVGLAFEAGRYSFGFGFSMEVAFLTLSLVNSIKIGVVALKLDTDAIVKVEGISYFGLSSMRKSYFRNGSPVRRSRQKRPLDAAAKKTGASHATKSPSGPRHSASAKFVRTENRSFRLFSRKSPPRHNSLGVCA